MYLERYLTDFNDVRRKVRSRAEGERISFWYDGVTTWPVINNVLRRCKSKFISFWLDPLYTQQALPMSEFLLFSFLCKIIYLGSSHGNSCLLGTTFMVTRGWILLTFSLAPPAVILWNISTTTTFSIDIHGSQTIYPVIVVVNWLLLQTTQHQPEYSPTWQT